MEALGPQMMNRTETEVQREVAFRCMEDDASGGCHYIDRRATPRLQIRSWTNFTASNLLPNSVYLWACDEGHQNGESRPSRSDAWVAWIVLIVSVLVW